MGEKPFPDLSKQLQGLFAHEGHSAPGSIVHDANSKNAADVATLSEDRPRVSVL
jgi:hypothetical protein